MPIRRCHGWGARCRRCGRWVDLAGGDTVYAWERREEVVESLYVQPGESQEDAITDLCGCQRTGRR